MTARVATRTSSTMSAMKLYYWPVLARASHSLLILCWTEQKYEFVTPEWPGTLVFPSSEYFWVKCPCFVFACAG